MEAALAILMVKETEKPILMGERVGLAGSASPSGDSGSDSDRMMLGVRGGFHKHMRQRAEVSTPTEMIPQDRRGKSRRGGGGRRVETKEKSKA